MTNTSDKKLAKRLAVLIADAGEEAVVQVKPVLEKVLEGRSSLDRHRFLKEFNHCLKREFHKDSLTIEAPGGPSEEVVASLTAQFQKGRARKLQVNRVSNDALIGGVRVRLGDTVYDASVSSKLSALATNIR